MIGYIGEVTLFAGRLAPRGWLPCNGAILPFKGNEPLFSLMGGNFGGSFPDTFALPSIPSPIPNMQVLVCRSGVFPSSRASDTLGEVKLFASDRIRANDSYECDGRLLAISSHPPLFSVMGSTFGGNGLANFAIPQLAAPGGMQYRLGIDGAYLLAMGMGDQAIGQVRLIASPTIVPHGWAVCDGRLLPFSFAALYAMLGSRFGLVENGGFRLPNLPPPLAGTRYVIAAEGIYPTP